MGDVSEHCVCDQVRYKILSDPLWTALCHCESCRRACSAPMMAWMEFRPNGMIWEDEWARRPLSSSQAALVRTVNSRASMPGSATRC